MSESAQLVPPDEPAPVGSFGRAAVYHVGMRILFFVILQIQIQRQPDLLQIVLTVDALRLVADRVQSGQQKPRKDRNDRNYNEEFYERKMCIALQKREER